MVAECVHVWGPHLIVKIVQLALFEVGLGILGAPSVLDVVMLQLTPQCTGASHATAGPTLCSRT